MRQLNLYKKYIVNSTPNLTNSLHFFFVIGPRNCELKYYAEIIKDHGWNYIECPFVTGSIQKQLFIKY